MKIVIRTDASVGTGTGHLVRCGVLARELTGRGCDVTFLCHKMHESIKGLLPVEAGIRLVEFDSGDASDVLVGSGMPDWLVVDHYDIDSKWESAVRSNVKKIMVIDDLANRKHDCDLLLDQNYYPTPESRYAALLDASCERLYGPGYAILKPEFGLITKNRTKPGAVKWVLVCFGGTDPGNETGKVIEAIKQSGLDGVCFDVVVGAANPNRENIRALCGAMQNMNYHCQAQNMAELMAGADLFVGAGGTLAWERCCAGLPAVVIAIADNQIECSEALFTTGAIEYLGVSDGVDPVRIARSMRALLGDPEKLGIMADAGRKLVDGLGARRVACRMLGPYTLRRAGKSDLMTYYNWTNDLDVRANSFSSTAISLEGHEKWFAARIVSADCKMYVLEYDSIPVGQIRFYIMDGVAEIGFSIDRNYRGKGLGKLILQKGVERLRRESSSLLTIIGAVKLGNTSSNKAFLSSGFVLSGKRILNGEESNIFCLAASPHKH